MKKIIDIISEEMKKAFTECGYEEKYGAASVSNRPDLCEYQCNGSLAAAKAYKKAPMVIAAEVIEKVNKDKFSMVEAVAPGFININVSKEFLMSYVEEMAVSEKFGCEPVSNPVTIVIDYGGANVAKPLHVGHLRPAVIGESIKRIKKYAGYKVVGDAHLGDWGRPMGLIITWLKRNKPELVYFDKDYNGEYPLEAPFTLSELEMIYPEASEIAKTDDVFLEEARQAILELQNGNKGYFALWKHIINVSVTDIKRVYDRLNVNFEVWGKESDAQSYIPDMVQYMKDEGYAHIDDGALVVDVKEETDTKEMPPCMILKSNGATLYDTTDLATIVERVKLYNPDEIVYVVDKRQGLYFERIFRCAKKTKLVRDDVKLYFVGNGTMNGSDNKPFKTRDGGVMRLDSLIDDISGAVYDKVIANRVVEEAEARNIADKVGLAALKYGDLSNQATKDYIFDVDRFTSFEGNTGPYICYTIVRIKSILAKCAEAGIKAEFDRTALAGNNSEINILLTLSRFSDMIEHASDEYAPHKVCQYIYELADNFNAFYHENKIVTEEDKKRQSNWVAIIKLVLSVLETGIDLLGIEAPERM